MTKRDENVASCHVHGGGGGAAVRTLIAETHQIGVQCLIVRLRGLFASVLSKLPSLAPGCTVGTQLFGDHSLAPGLQILRLDWR